MLHLSIDYDEEGSIESYQGFVVKDSDGTEIRRFNTGKPERDHKDFMSWAVSEEVKSIMYSSSVDHFVMDIPGFKWIIDDGIERLVVDPDG